MRILGNILWLLIVGFWLAIGYIIAGIINCIFIVTVPLGIQSFKLAGFALWPFGRAVVRADGDKALSTVANFIWFFISGIWLAIAHVVLGLLLCVTVIGIPFGVVSFRMARLALFPFGKKIIDASAAGPNALLVVGPVGAPPLATA